MTRDEFLQGVGNWSNHRYLLWPALESLKGSNCPVIELGCGDGSTPYLQKYCSINGIQLFSYDYDKAWAEKYGATHVTDWDKIPWRDHQYSVCLVDESPGEHRKESIKKILAKIIIVHDSEPVGWNSSDYQVRPLFNKFRYVKDLQSEYKGGAWATALSNFIDVTKFEV